jgi:hypothetical protein
MAPCVSTKLKPNCERHTVIVCRLTVWIGLPQATMNRIKSSNIEPYIQKGYISLRTNLWGNIEAEKALKRSCYYMYHQFNIEQFYVPPTQCIYVILYGSQNKQHYAALTDWFLWLRFTFLQPSGYYTWSDSKVMRLIFSWLYWQHCSLPTRTAFDLGPSLILTCSGMAVQCLSLE